MSEISGELVRVSDAFERPTLSLLHQKFAPVVVAILNTCFSREVRQVPTARLHILVDDLLAQLANSGITDVPSGSGRDVCSRWTASQWLIRSTAWDGSEVYSLTSHAQQALDFIVNLRQERTGLSENRIANIVATARRINRESNPDRESRIAILDTEITQLTVERDRLEAGGEIKPMTGDRILEGLQRAALAGLAVALGLQARRRSLPHNSGRGSGGLPGRTPGPGRSHRPVPERTDDLITATAEGRAFEGAFVLLRDADLLEQLRQDVSAIIREGDSILVDSDRAELRGIVPLMMQGLDSVLDQRSRITEVLRTYITTRDAAKDRELDRVLRSLEGAVPEWLTIAGPRESVPIDLLPGQVDIEHLRERFYDPSDDLPVPDLPEDDEGQPEALSLEELRRLGGPRMTELQAAIEGTKRRADGWSLGQLFAELPDDLRRPVDVLGLLHLATNDDELVVTSETEPYFTIRPDGTTRMFHVPVLAPGNAPEEEDL